MDFKSFPKDDEGNNMTFGMMDRLTKLTWMTACNDTVTAKDAAEMYYRGPFRIFGWPETFTSDRGPQFISDFTDELSKIHGTKLNFASAGHHETVGLIENMHQWIDQRLRPFIDHHQKDWSRALPALDAVQASLPHDSLGGLTPREVLTGRPMRMPFDWESRTKTLASRPLREQLSRQDAQEFARRVQDYVEVAREHAKESQRKMAEQVNRHRRIPDFGAGDFVYVLRSKGELTDRPSDKLDYPMTRRPYKILQARPNSPNTFELELPNSWKGSKWFHADRLRKYPNSPLPGQDYERPTGEIVDPALGEEEFEVDKILTSKLRYRKLYYQVSWKGWDPDSEWYLAENFKNAPEKLSEYHERNPDKPGPPLRLEQWLMAAQNDELDPAHEDDNRPARELSRQGTRMRRRRRGV
jgi:hypothetical protein